jgi:hypothetical protein
MEALTEDYLNNADQVGDMTTILVGTKHFERKKQGFIDETEAEETMDNETKDNELGGNVLVGKTGGNKMGDKSGAKSLDGTAVRKKPTVKFWSQLFREPVARKKPVHCGTAVRKRNRYASVPHSSH